VGVIQREIEGSGITTASISLVRRFTELLRPPRAFWVPFPFARPLGAPRNEAVQRLVLLSALELLERPKGPVLEDLILPPEFAHLDARYQTIGRKCSPSGCDLNTALSGASAGEGISDEPKPYDGNFNPRNAAVFRTVSMWSGGDPGLAGWGGRIRNFAFRMIVSNPMACGRADEPGSASS
jgi:hypothetical protein